MAAIITRRLLGVVLLFALLDICLVLTTYVQDQEGLGQRLLSLQAEEIGEAIIVEDFALTFRSRAPLSRTYRLSSSCLCDL